MTNPAPTKDRALADWSLRREANRDTVRIDNAALKARDPMHYYCASCGQHMILDELHLEPAPKLCPDCDNMKTQGWLPQ